MPSSTSRPHRLLAIALPLLGLAAGCLGAEDELLAEDDLGTEAAALVSPQVAGLSSSGVPDPMAAVDGDLATGTTVDSAVGNCPLYNGGPFIKLNAGHCLFTPTGTTFFGWAMVKLRVGNGGDVDLVELRLTHDRTGSTASPAPQTLVYTSWDGKAFSAQGAFTASTTRTTSTIRLVPPTRPAPYVWVVLGKSTVSAAAPAGPTLRWFELAATHLAPPAGLTARAVSATAIDLSWADTSTAETGFEVFMQPAGGAWRSLGLDPGGANQTSERITGLAPSTTYAFQLRARSGTVSSRPSNTASATTLAGPPGRLALVNNSQVDILQVWIDGVARAPGQVVGNQGLFDLPAGTYRVVAALGFGPGAGIAAGAEVCDASWTVTVTSGQTVTRSVAPLTAGQVLTHCGPAADYAQGGYTDLTGYHTVALRFHASGAFDYWHDNVRQPSGTITSTTFNPPWLTFTLSTGDVLTMGWPYGTLDVRVGTAPVRLLRATAW